MTSRRRFNWVKFFLLLYPAMEIIALVAVIQLVGWFWALILLAAGFLAGVLVMRLAGANAFRALTNAEARMRGVDVQGPDGTTQRVQQPPSAASIAQARQEVGASSMLFLAGILLAVPGFISDLLGLLLLIPGVSQRVGNAWSQRMQARAARSRVTVIQGETMPDGTSTWRTTTMSADGGSTDRSSDAARRDGDGSVAQLPPARAESGEVIEGDVVNRPKPDDFGPKND